MGGSSTEFRLGLPVGLRAGFGNDLLGGGGAALGERAEGAVCSFEFGVLGKSLAAGTGRPDSGRKTGPGMLATWPISRTMPLT